MAKDKNPKKDKEEKKDDTAKGVLAVDLLKAHLKDNKEDHFNGVTEKSSIISTGSLLFDIEVGGGVLPCVIRMSGATGGGKTSSTLSLLKNFLENPKGRRGLYVKAEGKLPLQMQQRSGVKFVDNEEDWVDGTCFVLKCNIYETVANLVYKLIRHNDKGLSYFFVLDSMDALIPKADAAKLFEENGRVSGASGITSHFLRKMALPISVGGHYCVLINQVRSKVETDKYAKKTYKPTDSSGGFALDHYPEWIFEFLHHASKEQQIMSKAAKVEDQKNIGHWARVIFRKTPNEKDGLLVSYPIQHNQTGGSSIWREYEIVDVLISQEHIKKGGSWFTFPEELRKEVLEKTKIEMPEKLQGEDQVREFFMENNAVTDYFFNKIRFLLS